MAASLGTVLLATCVAGGVVGCSKKKEDQAEKAQSERRHRPQGDRYADGQRLTAALKDWTKRWADTADLPDCTPLLKAPADLELCKNAAAALTTMKAAAAKPEAEAVLIHDAAELAFATETASERLRAASMEKMEAEHKDAERPAGAPSAHPAATKPPTVAAVSSSKTHPAPSASIAIADKLKAVETAPLDPAMQVMQAYSRVNRASLRYLSQFLQFGALPTRKATFTELEALAKRKETWPALGRTLREAAMAENDPELQGKLKALAPSLSRRAPSLGAPAASAIPQGVASGRPQLSVPGQAPPPKPAAP